MMSITLKGKRGKEYEFKGPYRFTITLKDNSGVYAILCKREDGLYLLDVGEAKEVKFRVEHHERKECWIDEKECEDENLRYAVHYTPNAKKAGRLGVEQDIRKNYSGLCGES
ncbi:MAG: hypothetical protein U9R01_08645 [candidate division WOR-3 bacterium]|nr:hypothetical protein [candidate division WOR-3 bacterium]